VKFNVNCGTVKNCHLKTHFNGSHAKKGSSNLPDLLLPGWWKNRLLTRAMQGDTISNS